MISELQIGVITQTHGLHGEVKVFPTTDDARRFNKLKEVILDDGKKRQTIAIDGVRFFKKYVILKFNGLDSIEAVEKYKNAKLLVSRDNAVKLKKDEYFIADMIGMQVNTEDGKPFGILKDVLTTGANDVYIVEMTDGKEALLPAIKECILNVDMEAAVMTVHIMEGLLS